MKRKSVVISLIVILCAGLGFYSLLKLRGAASASDEEEGKVPTVVSVQTGKLKLMTLHHDITGYGQVEPAPATRDEPAAAAPLAAPSAGVVAQVNVAQGERVNRGDVLVTLNSSAMTADYAEQELARQNKLFAEHNTSLKNLQDAQAQLAALQVVSPLSGTVVSLNVKPGAAVDASTVVAEVMDLNRLAVSTAFPASDAADLKIGEEVQVLDGSPVSATISFVSPVLDANSGTISTWAMLPADSGLRPGEFVPLKIVTSVHTNCLAAPDASVVTDAKGQSVIALVDGDEATYAPVRTGFRENGWVEVTGSGLKAGDTVVTVGAYGLPEKTKIEVVKPGSDDEK